MPEIDTFLTLAGDLIELGGVAIMLFGIVGASLFFAAKWAVNRNFAAAYEGYRQNVGRAILLGLEFLIAADIIGTVLVTPTLQNVRILALIVLIRTFLSYSLEVEITGRLPWARNEENDKTAEAQRRRGF